MPEGDSLHRAAARLRVLEGQVVSASSAHPRARALRIAERIDGRRPERSEAVGGRWQVHPADARPSGSPWLRGEQAQGVLWNGPVLELSTPALARLRPDVMRDPPDLDELVRRFRAADQAREVGEALLDQRLVAGIGNVWKAEGLFGARISPWAQLSALSDQKLRELLEGTSRLMRAGRTQRTVYRRAGRQCRRCGEVIRSAPQGDEARTAYWCPRCQNRRAEG